MFVDELAQPLEAADLGSLRAMLSANLGSAAMSSDYRKIFSDRTKIFQHHFAHAFTGSPDFIHGDNAFEVLRVNFVAAHGGRGTPTW